MENTTNQEVPVDTIGKIEESNSKRETRKNLAVNMSPYLANMVLGTLENAKVMVQDYPGYFGNAEPLGRATAGLKGIIDNNLGDSVIVGINTLGAEVLLGVVDKVSKKVGGKGINPEIRFLSALTIGVAMTTYMESRSDFLIGLPNTPDFVWGGDMFGIALGAAAMLVGRVVAEKMSDSQKTSEQLQSPSEKIQTRFKTAAQKFEAFGKKLGPKLKEAKSADNPLVEESSEELAQLINES